MTKKFVIAYAILAGGVAGGDPFVVRSPNFTVNAPTLQLAQRVAHDAEVAYRDCERFFGGVAPAPLLRYCSVFVDQDGFAGLTTPIGIFLMVEVGAPQAGPDLDTIVRHEITHVYLLSHGFPPRLWIHEGLAMLMEEEYPEALGEKCGDWGFYEFFAMGSYPEDRYAFYGQALSVTSYLMATYGLDATMAFAVEGQEAGWDVASLTVLGMALDDLEASWRRSTGSWESYYPTTWRGR